MLHMRWLKVFAQGLSALPLDTGLSSRLKGFNTPGSGLSPGPPGVRESGVLPLSKGFYPQAQGLALRPRTIPPGLRALPLSKGF